MSIETTAQDGHLHFHTVPELCDALPSVFRVHFNESREGFCRKGRGRSFHADGPKIEKAQKPTVESLARGIRRLRVLEADKVISA